MFVTLVLIYGSCDEWFSSSSLMSGIGSENPLYFESGFSLLLSMLGISHQVIHPGTLTVWFVYALLSLALLDVLRFYHTRKYVLCAVPAIFVMWFSFT